MKARRCVICGKYFSPYSRKSDEQVLCGRRECRLRKRQDWERDWWRNNPECLPERKRKTGIWAKGHDYWRLNRVEMLGMPVKRSLPGSSVYGCKM